MNYNDFRPTSAGAAKPDAKTGPQPLFVRLLPSGTKGPNKVLDPSGPYHLNHFIVYFTIDGETFTEAEGRKAAGILTYRFLRSFCRIFSEENIAAAAFGRRDLKELDGSRTVEFTIGGNVGSLVHSAIGLVHPDWVVMSGVPDLSVAELASEPQLASFYGDTLKRLWSTTLESVLFNDAAAAKSELELQIYAKHVLASPLPELLMAAGLLRDRALLPALLEVNRQHFLAGTRSWSVGYDSALKQFFVETLAIERFSCTVYRLAENAHSTRDDILDLWDHLLANFIDSDAFEPRRFTPVPPPASLADDHDYGASTILEHIRHQAWEFDELYYLQKEFVDPNPSPAMKSLKHAHAGLVRHMKG